MKDVEIRPSMGIDYPMMKLPKQEKADSSFEEKCHDLDDIISRCYDFFMWYGGRDKCRCDELRSTLFLECLFLQILTIIHEIIQMRGHLLLDECCDLFRKRLKMLNEKMRAERFIINYSNATVLDELSKDASWITNERQDAVEGFREHSKWLELLTTSPKNRARAIQLANTLQLNYSMKLFGCMGDDFSQHTNMVFNALMLLTMPSLADYSEQEFAQVFQNSINTFRKSRQWLSIEAQMEDNLKNDLKHENCDTYSAKMARVKEEWWKPRKDAIENYLERFGITYINVLSQTNMGQLGRQLYERLNGIRIDKHDETPLVSMTNDDLCQYLKLESELQFFAAKIEKYRELGDDPLPPDSYFVPKAQRMKIRQAIYKTIYEKGENKREVLYAQSHWFAIHKVFMYHKMCVGTLKDFQAVMSKWFATAPHPCDYDSLKNMKVVGVRDESYVNWSAANHSVIPYRRVALTLARYLREEGLID